MENKKILRGIRPSTEVCFFVVYVLLMMYLRRYVQPLNNITTYITLFGVFTSAALWWRSYLESRPKIDIKLLKSLPFNVHVVDRDSSLSMNFPLTAFDKDDNLYIFMPLDFINQTKHDNCIREEIYVIKSDYVDEVPLAISRGGYSDLSLFNLPDTNDFKKKIEELSLPIIIKSFTAVRYGIVVKIQREILNEFIPREEMIKSSTFTLELWVFLRPLKGEQTHIIEKINIKHKFNDNYKKIFNLDEFSTDFPEDEMVAKTDKFIAREGLVVLGIIALTLIVSYAAKKYLSQDGLLLFAMLYGAYWIIRFIFWALRTLREE